MCTVWYIYITTVWKNKNFLNSSFLWESIQGRNGQGLIFFSGYNMVWGTIYISTTTGDEKELVTTVYIMGLRNTCLCTTKYSMHMISLIRRSFNQPLAMARPMGSAGVCISMWEFQNWNAIVKGLSADTNLPCPVWNYY